MLALLRHEIRWISTAKTTVLPHISFDAHRSSSHCMVFCHECQWLSPAGTRTDESVPECFVHLRFLGECWRQSLTGSRNLCEASQSQPAAAARPAARPPHIRPLHIKSVLGRHALDQGDEIRSEAWLGRTGRARLSTPEEPESLAVPPKHRLRLDQEQRAAPTGQQSSAQDQ
jgi:hypothetical protein